MAPETMCMLLVWAKAESVLEARTTCRTLKAATDEVVPWMVEIMDGHAKGGRMMMRLAATEVETMRRTVLHAKTTIAGDLSWPMYAAALMGSVDVMEHLHSNGCEWDHDVCVLMARRGHLEALKYLRGAGCPWDGRMCYEATVNGHDHVLEWAHAGVRTTWPCARVLCAWVRC